MNHQSQKILLSLIKERVCGGDDCLDIGKEQLSQMGSALYRDAKRHDMAHIVADVLEKKHALFSEEECYAKFRKQKMLAVFRYEKICHEYQQICDVFDREHIPYLPLKGAVIRQYYPEPWMRTSCDIDILVHQGDLDRACRVLVSDLAYRKGEQGTHDISLYSPGEVHLELHYALVAEHNASDHAAILKRVWDSTALSSGDGSRFEMSDEMFFFYHVAHMANHIEIGGCGIRPFLDLWILEHRVEHDDGKRNILLEQGRLLKFADVARRLAEVWFGELAHCDVTRQLEQYVLHGGVYGTLGNRIAIQQKKRGGK